MPERTTQTIRRHHSHPSLPPSAKHSLRPLAAALFALLSFPPLSLADPAEPPTAPSEPSVEAPAPSSSTPLPAPQPSAPEEAEATRTNYDQAFARRQDGDFRQTAFARRTAETNETDESLFREADDVMPLRLTVPPLRPSRIDFPDERILSVVVDSSHVEVRGESDRSDFFLLPKYPGSTTLFVTLARGETVPVEVTVRGETVPVEVTVREDAKPRNVVLHLKDRNAKPAATLRADLPAMKSVPYADLFTGLLTDLENGRLSRSVMTVASGPDAPLTPAVRTVVSRLSPLSVTTDAVWRTRELTVTRLIVRNGKLREAVVDEAALLTDGVLAFAAGKPSLKPAEAMHFYVFEAK